MKKLRRNLMGVLVMLTVLMLSLQVGKPVKAANDIVGEIPINQTFTVETDGYYSFTLDECSSVKLGDESKSLYNWTFSIYAGKNYERIAYVYKESNSIRLAPGEYYFYFYRGDIVQLLITGESSMSYEQENNGSFDLANSILTNIAYTGNNHDRDDIDYFKFSVNQTGSFYIDFIRENDSNDHYIEIYSEDDSDLNTKKLFDFNCSSGKFSALSQKIRIPAGNYYVKIYTGYYTNNYDYTFKVVYEAEFPDSFEQEYNNTPSSANNIEYNQFYTGNIPTIDSEEDVDYYKVTVPESGLGQLIMQIPRQTIDKLFKVELYKADNMSTPIDTLNTTTNPTAYGNERLLSPGDYYIAVKKGSQISSHVDYKIQLAFNKTVLIESLSLSMSSYTYYVDDKATITASISPANPDNRTLTWESGDKKVVTVDSLGKITCIGPGVAYITAKTNDGSNLQASVIITVAAKKILIERLTLSASSSTYYIGDKSTITANISPANPDNETLIWDSTDKKVVTVDSLGRITCVGKGTAYITAKATDGSNIQASIKITVKEKIKEEPIINEKPEDNTKDTTKEKPKETTKNSNAKLSKITISTGKLNRSFSPNRTSYTLTLSKNTNKVKITPIVANKKATYTIDGKKVKDTTVLMLSQKSKIVKIKVTAENGSVKTYTITIKKK